MGANFTPTLDGYSGQGAFRFWCQKVLPLVYDDSLSYMELLAKVVDYLNNTISDVATVENNVTELSNAYNELQDYVNDYFDNLDINTEVEAKIDSMVTDGTFTRLITPIVETETSRISEYVTAWLTENVTPVGSAVVVDPSLTISGAAADSKVVGDKFDEIGDVNNITIENYNRGLDELEGLEIQDNKFMNTSLVVQDSNAWALGRCPVEGNHKYYIKATGTVGNMAFYWVIGTGDYIPCSETGNVTIDGVYTSPSNAVRIIINRNKTQGMPFIGEYNYNFTLIKSSLAKLTASGNYRVNANGYQNVVALNKSNNGTVKFIALYKGGYNAIKQVDDDITPVRINNTYLGANHGYPYVFNCTANNHGLLDTDIGKKYTDANNEYIVLQIIDENHVIIGNINDSNWYGLDNNAPTQIILNGGSIPITNAVITQLYPSVKNIDVSILENNEKSFIIKESYDIIDLKTGIAEIYNNIGDNDNDSIANRAEGMVHVSNIYTFDINGGCIIDTQVTALKDLNFNFYGGIQSMAYPSTNGFAVSDTSFMPLAAAGTEHQFAKSVWNDEDKAPSLFIQTNGAINPTESMLLGYIKGKRDILNGAGFIASSQKMYPYLSEPNRLVNAGYSISGKCFRLPCSFNNNVCYNLVEQNDTIYIAVFMKVGSTIKIDIPTYCKEVNVISNDGTSVETLIATDYVEVTSSGPSACILELK